MSESPPQPRFQVTPPSSIMMPLLGSLQSVTSPQYLHLIRELFIGYSSALGSGGADAELALAVAPLFSLAFSFASWLSILACSFFTSSSSSAWRDVTNKSFNAGEALRYGAQSGGNKKSYKTNSSSFFCFVLRHLFHQENHNFTTIYDRLPWH